MERFDWNLLIRHGHWITIDFGKRQVNVCARCSGTILGFFSFIALANIIELSVFVNLRFQEQLIICVLLALPAGLDWLSQACGLRESTNYLRGTTGFLEGAAVALFSTSAASIELKFLAILVIGGAISILGLLGKKLVSRASKQVCCD
jgi:uncharacterized membrane protein